MLKIDPSEIEIMEKHYPGIRRNINTFENAALPACTLCGSTDTADVQIGIIGRTINLAAATTKFKLIPNGPRPGRYFCNTCKRFFSPDLEKENNNG